MRKYFKNNSDYFKFLDKIKDTCYINYVKITKKMIVLDYKVED